MHYAAGPARAHCCSQRYVRRENTASKYRRQQTALRHNASDAGLTLETAGQESGGGCRKRGVERLARAMRRRQGVSLQTVRRESKRRQCAINEWQEKGQIAGKAKRKVAVCDEAETGSKFANCEKRKQTATMHNKRVVRKK